MQKFRAFHFFLFATSALLVAQYIHNVKVSIGFYFISLVLYILALLTFYKEKNQTNNKFL